MAIIINPPKEWEFDGNRLGYLHKITKAFLPDRELERLGGWKNIMEKVKPIPVKKIVCSVCGELLAKLYPFTSLQVPPDLILKCTKCIAKGK